jgi:hypothetical protein
VAAIGVQRAESVQDTSDKEEDGAKKNVSGHRDYICCCLVLFTFFPSMQLFDDIFCEGCLGHCARNEIEQGADEKTKAADDVKDSYEICGVVVGEDDEHASQFLATGDGWLLFVVLPIRAHSASLLGGLLKSLLFVFLLVFCVVDRLEHGELVVEGRMEASDSFPFW